MGCHMMAVIEGQCGPLIMMDTLPSVDEYMGTLQTCRKNKDLNYAHRLHVQICSQGLEVQAAIGNCLIPTYVDCGSMLQAQQVFCKLDYPSERAWTSLILGLVECEEIQEAFDLYEHMQTDGIQPSGQTYLALLKACAKLEYAGHGHYVHTEIIKGGYETDIFVANALIDMHAKHGSLADAQSVFDMLPTRDIVSWNALMVGYADCDLAMHVFELFQRLQADEIDPNERTFVCLLRSCAKLRAVSQGLEIHDWVVREGLDNNMYVSSALVDMYAKGGLLTEARDVFDQLPVQDVILWTALISGFAEHGLCNEVCSLLKEMQCKGTSPNSITWMFGLKACQTAGLIGKGQAIHDEIVKRSLESILGSSLLAFYADCGLLGEARQVFNKLPTQDAISWTALITGYVDYGLAEEAINCFNEMEESVTLNSFMLACIARACGACKDLDRGFLNHGRIIQDGFEDNAVICNSLIEMYINCSLLAEAEDLFNDLLDRDVVSWSALIKGYIEHDLAEKALGCFTQMQLEGLSPDEIAFVSVLRACGILQALQTGQEVHSQVIMAGFKEDSHIGISLIAMYAKCGIFYDARQILTLVQDAASWNVLITGYIEKEMNTEAINCLLEMHTNGVVADHMTYTYCLKACGNLGATDEGQVIHCDVLIRGFDEDPLVGNSLVLFYLKCNLHEDANKVFDKLLVRDVFSWNGLITGYADKGCAEHGIKCLSEMQLQGVAPNAVSYIEALRSCSRSSALNEGLHLHGELVRAGFDADPCIISSLVDMYAKCGSLAEARFVFDRTSTPALVAWTALMAGYVDYGFDEEALNLLETMQSEGLCLDAVMYACSLNACGSSRQVDRVQHLHAEILKEGYEIDLYVGSVLVDCYAKCGSVVEAQDVFDEMIMHNPVSWSALLIGYMDNELHSEALTFLDRLLLEEEALDATALICGLKACGDLRVIEKGLELHFLIVKKGFEEDPLVSTTLVSMYSKCGWFLDSLEVFDCLLVHDVISWNALMVGHIEHGLREKVLDFSEHMQLEGVLLNVLTLVFCLGACSGLNAVKRGQELHLYATKLGLEADSFPGNSLIEMYAECGLLEEAHHAHQSLLLRDTSSWNALIKGYVICDLCTEAFNLLEEMHKEEVFPDAISFATILTGCKRVDNIDLAQKTHIEIMKEGFEDDLVVVKSLVVVYARFGFLVEAQDLFNNSPIQDARLWGEMLMSNANEGESERVLVLYACMQEQGVLPNSVAFVSSLRACGNLLALDRGRRLHVQVCKVIDLQESKAIIASALVDMYGKCGSMGDAQQEFDAMPKEDVTGWNALITGYAREGKSDLVFHIFERMREDGVTPNEITFLIVLTVCSHGGLMEKGQAYYEVMVREYGMAPAIKHQSTLIDLVGRTGQLDEAVLLVEDMQSVVDNAVWDSMLGACQKWGDFKLGSEAFDRAATLEAGSFVLMSNICADAYA
ncbi:hypothetical protein GOP47_0018310 [Adiantum capillus-veneris]|uniref:Pentatricopeptide repeat-containing protein n=1 Tax=Adiantum capillus-veneris TaxID=13818 RepID=A0A9D4UHI2_ADICA|nr:hypothetical protein GOP47_0018310 [Adiantum capillus-veneris]